MHDTMTLDAPVGERGAVRSAAPRLISPSELTVAASGTALGGGTAALIDGRCAMCGQTHVAGELVQPFKPGATFTDLSALACATSRVVCRACIAVWTLDFTQRYAKSVVCAEGVFPAAKNDHIAYWLLNPPPPPFLFYLSDQKQQHLVWRAPVNLSTELYQVRFGMKTFTIRRAHLAAALESARTLAAALSDERRAKGNRGAPVKSPFTALARENDDLHNGMLRNSVIALAAGSPALQAHVDTILHCTPGEIWGLSALLYAKEPHRPAPSLVPAA